MFTMKRPTDQNVRRYLDSLAEQPWSYSQIGGTRHRAPAGFDADTAKVCLGQGGTTFLAAKRAVQDWEMFPDQMAQVFWKTTPIAPGQIVAVLFRAGPMWSLNPCRIVYVIDESTSSDGKPSSTKARFGFAYGTLHGHVECGEESFLIHWRDDDTVWYELSCFSRPRHWIAKVGYPITRLVQKRFRTLSTKSMRDAVRLKLGSLTNSVAS